MDIFDVIRDRKKQAVFNMMLEEACRQWCCFIDDAPERKDGEGFAQFFFEIFEGKEKDYWEQIADAQPFRKNIKQNLER